MGTSYTVCCQMYCYINTVIITIAVSLLHLLFFFSENNMDEPDILCFSSFSNIQNYSPSHVNLPIDRFQLQINKVKTWGKSHLGIIYLGKYK